MSKTDEDNKEEEGTDESLVNDFKEMLDDKEEKESPKEEEKEEEEPKKEEKEEAKEEKTEEKTQDKKSLKDAVPGPSLDFPEDTVLSDSVRTKFTQFADNVEMDDDTLNDIFDMLEDATQEGHSLAKGAESDKADKNYKELISDPLFSNDNRAKTIENIESVVEKFGGDDVDEINKALSTPGFLTLPMARLLNSLGASLNEKPEFGNKSVDMKTPEDEKKVDKDVENAKNYHSVFFH